MLESYANQPYNAESSYNNVGVVFSSNGAMGHGLMTSANGLRGDVNHGDNQLIRRGNTPYISFFQWSLRHSSLLNDSAKHQTKLFNTTFLDATPPRQCFTLNPSRFRRFSKTLTAFPGMDMTLSRSRRGGTTATIFTCQIAIFGAGTALEVDGYQMVGIGNGIQGGFNSTVGIMDSVANNNSFDMINETTQKANKNVAPLGQGNFDLAQGGFGSASTSGLNLAQLKLLTTHSISV
ncbi:hypothetical protein JHK87_025095 [Glycine soja]|nr:hypothetical protein JHK87_025095 [Glycine soja]